MLIAPLDIYVIAAVIFGLSGVIQYFYFLTWMNRVGLCDHNALWIFKISQIEPEMRQVIHAAVHNKRLLLLWVINGQSSATQNCTRFVVYLPSNSVFN